MAALAHTRFVPPPSAQEIQRKLSTSRPPKQHAPQPAFSGTESDSDSVLSPDVGSPPAPSFLAAASQAPLCSIAERRVTSGEETDEEDEEDEDWQRQPASARPANTGSSKLETESVLKSGYLWKKGIRRKNWKKRWFVLRQPHLAYYKSSAEYKLLRLLDLHEVHSVASCSLKNHSNTFGVVSPNRTFYLQAETEEEMQNWVKALNEARVTLQSTTTITSVQQITGPPTPQPIAIPVTTRGAPLGGLPSPITPSPPSQPHIHHVASSDSEEGSPTAAHPATRLGLGASLPTGNVTSVQDPTKILVTGYLMKCSSKRKNWHKRWFTLSGEKLVYSVSHMDTRPHREIALTEIVDALEFRLPAGRHPHSPTTSSPGPTPGDDQDDMHTFKVITPKRTLLLCAPSEEEEIKWLSAIRALIARRSGGGTTVGAQAPSETAGRKKEAERRSMAMTALTVTGEGGSGQV